MFASRFSVLLRRIPCAVLAFSMLAFVQCDESTGPNGSSSDGDDAGTDSATPNGDSGTTTDGGPDGAGPTALTVDNFRGYISARMSFRAGGNNLFVAGEFFVEPTTDQERAALKTIAEFFVPTLVPKDGCVSGPEPQRPGDPPGLKRFDVQSMTGTFNGSGLFEIPKVAPGEHYGSVTAPDGDGPIAIQLHFGLSPFLSGDAVGFNFLRAGAALPDAGGSVQLTRGQPLSITVDKPVPPGRFVRASLGFLSTRVTCTALGTSTITIPASVIDTLPDSGDVELGTGSFGLLGGAGGVFGAAELLGTNAFNYHFF